VKKFGYDIVRVNNQDMLSTYSKGDAVLLKKSFNRYTTGDVVYLEYPVEDSALTRTFFFQRIYGLPGDSLKLADKEVYINGMKLQDTASLRHNYFVKGVKKLDSLFLHEHDLTEGGIISDEFDYSFSLTRYQSEQLRSEPYVSEVTVKTEKTNNFDETCFPGDPRYSWNMDHFGPIYIPKANDTLLLDTNNLKLYGQIIRMHEKNDLRVQTDSIFINGELTKRYVVKKNYYFVLGDNRDNANDSRTWGYLPANFILGKAVHTVRRSR
jgi:signal peptidase I